MKVTFMVGNGFDLGAGYRTSYSDFYGALPALIDGPRDRPYGDIVRQAIKVDQIKGREYWRDFELGLGHFTDMFSGDNFASLIRLFPTLQEKTGGCLL